MKAKLRITLMLAMALWTCAAYSQTIFPTLANNKNVESVYISNALLKMAGSGSNQVTSGFKISKNTLDNINGLEIYSAENKTGVNACRNEITQFLNNNPKAELIMSSNNGDEKTRIYAIPGKNQVKYSSIIIIDEDTSEYDIVVFNGKLTENDLKAFSSDID